MSLRTKKGGELCISEKLEFEIFLEIKSDFENILELYTGKQFVENKMRKCKQLKEERNTRNYTSSVKKMT